jgi:hypothetical protein
MTKYNSITTASGSIINYCSFFHFIRYTLCICVILLTAASPLGADQPWRPLKPGEVMFYGFIDEHGGGSSNGSDLKEAIRKSKGKKGRIVDCRLNQTMTFGIYECGKQVVRAVSCNDVMGITLREVYFNCVKTPGTNHQTCTCKQGEYHITPISPIGNKTWNPRVPKVSVIVAVE